MAELLCPVRALREAVLLLEGTLAPNPLRTLPPIPYVLEPDGMPPPQFCDELMPWHEQPGVSCAEVVWEWLMRLDEPLAATQWADFWTDLAEHAALSRQATRHLASRVAYREFYEAIWEADAPPSPNDAYWAARQQARFAAVLNTAQSVSNARVLDLGSGNGTLAFALALQNTTVHGVNLLSSAVDQANAKARDWCLPATFASGFAEDGVAGYDADIVVAFEIIEHVPSPSALIGGMEASVKAGGVCVLSTPFGSTTIGEDTWATRDANGGALGDPLAHVRVYTPGRLRALLGGRDVTLAVNPGPGAGELLAWWRP